MSSIQIQETDAPDLIKLLPFNKGALLWILLWIFSDLNTKRALNYALYTALRIYWHGQIRKRPQCICRKIEPILYPIPIEDFGFDFMVVYFRLKMSGYDLVYVKRDPQNSDTMAFCRVFHHGSTLRFICDEICDQPLFPYLNG